VEEQLDLLAAGECDRPTRRAVEAHLESCPACSASYAESQRVQGMLDLHYNEAERQARLRRHIGEADRAARRPRVLPFVNRVASLAALLLVTFGLALLLPNWKEYRPGNDLTVEARVIGDARVLEILKGDPEMAPARAVDMASARLDGKAVHLSLPEAEQGSKFRQQLNDLHRKDERPPLPPPVPLALHVTNTTARPLDLRLDGDGASVSLDVKGPGVARLPAPRGEPPPLLRKSLRLAPRDGRTLPVERLIAGSRREHEYVYLLDPGKYTLTVRLRGSVNGAPVELTSGPISLQVADK
jgi:hypothetical protein